MLIDLFPHPYWRSYDVLQTDGRGEHHSEAHRQRAAHVEEFLAGRAHGHGGEASNDARRVPGGPQHQGPSQEGHGGYDCTHHTLGMRNKLSDGFS